MRIRVKAALAEWEELIIELPESKPTCLTTFPIPAFEIVAAIVYECAVRKQPILPCTFTIIETDAEYPITERDVKGFTKPHRFNSDEKQIIVEINNPRNSHLIKSVGIPPPIRPEVQELFENPQNTDEFMKLLRGVNEITLGGYLDEKLIDRLNLVVEKSLTLNQLTINGVTDNGATRLIQMLTENVKLNHFGINKISCKKKQMEANLFTSLIKALEYNLSFKNFYISKYEPNQFFYLALEAKLRKSARLAYVEFFLIKELFEALPIIPLVQIIYQYLSHDDFFALVDLNSAFMYYLMPQIPWNKLNDQGVYTLDFSSLKELSDFRRAFFSEIKSIDLFRNVDLLGSLTKESKCIERGARNKRILDARALGFNEICLCTRDSDFPNRIKITIPVQLWIFIFATGDKWIEQFQKLSFPVSESTTIDHKNTYNEYDQFIVCAQSKKLKQEQEQHQANHKKIGEVQVIFEQASYRSKLGT